MNKNEALRKLDEVIELLKQNGAGVSERAALALIDVRASLPAAEQPVSEQNARHAIDGAIQYGRMGINQPPSTDHWLMPYWQMGRQLAEAEQPQQVVSDELVFDVLHECMQREDGYTIADYGRALLAKATAQPKHCEHEFTYFGEQQFRRCVHCNVPEFKAATAQPNGFDAEFLSKRLARVATLTGVQMPDMTHEQIAAVAGTILAEIARKLEASATAQTDVTALVREAAKAGFIAAAKHPQHLKTTRNIAESADAYADLHVSRAIGATAQPTPAVSDLRKALQDCVDYGCMTGADWVREQAERTLSAPAAQPKQTDFSAEVARLVKLNDALRASEARLIAELEKLTFSPASPQQSETAIHNAIQQAWHESGMDIRGGNLGEFMQRFRSLLRPAAQEAEKPQATVMDSTKVEEVALAVYAADRFTKHDQVWHNLYWLTKFAQAIEVEVRKALPQEAAREQPAHERKDAERYRILRYHVTPAHVAENMGVPFVDLRENEAIEDRIDSLCDARALAEKGERK